jgi:hypothetical protein
LQGLSRERRSFHEGGEASAKEREHGVDDGGDVLRRGGAGSLVEGLEGRDQGGGDKSGTEVAGGGIREGVRLKA